MKILLVSMALIGIFLADLKGLFSFSDISFVLAVFLYVLFIRKWALGIGLFFLVVMSCFFIRSGVTARVERVGEWFYIFFVIGIIQDFLYTSLKDKKGLKKLHKLKKT